MFKNENSENITRTACYLSGVFTLILYELTNAKGFFWGDAGEFMAVSNSLGIGHAYGHPLFWLLGRASILLYPTHPAASMNHLTALFSAAASTVIAFLIRNQCKSRFRAIDQAIIIFSITGLYSTAFTIWTQATFTEVYNLHAFFLALSIYFYDRHLFHTGKETNLFASAYFFGIAVTLGLYSLILLPLFVPISLWAPRPKNVHAYLLGIVFLILGSSLWLYLPVRSLVNPPFLCSKIDSFRAFIVYLMRLEVKSDTLKGIHAFLFYFRKSLSILFSNLTLWGVFLLGIAAFQSIRKRANQIVFYFLAATASFLAFAILLPLTLNFRQLDEMDVYLIPVCILLIPVLTEGAVQLLTVLRNNRRFLLPVPILLIVVLRWNDVNISKNQTAQHFLDYLSRYLPQKSHIISASNAIGHSVYYAMFGLHNSDQYTAVNIRPENINTALLDTLLSREHWFIETNQYLLSTIDNLENYPIAGPFTTRTKDSIYAHDLEANFIKNFHFDENTTAKLHPLDRLHIAPMWARRGLYWLKVLNNKKSLDIQKRNAIYEKTILAFHQAAFLDNFSYSGAYYHGILALFSYNLNLLDDAERYAAQAIQIHPYAPLAYRTLFLVASKNKEPKNALRALENLASLPDQDGKIQFDLARQYLQLNEHDKAVQAYRKGIQLGAIPERDLETLLFPEED